MSRNEELAVIFAVAAKGIMDPFSTSSGYSDWAYESARMIASAIDAIAAVYRNFAEQEREAAIAKARMFTASLARNLPMEEQLRPFSQSAVGQDQLSAAQPQAAAQQKAACCSVGTKQCAPICMQHPPSFVPGECPEAYHVWTADAMRREQKRRPDGPLKEQIA